MKANRIISVVAALLAAAVLAGCATAPASQTVYRGDVTQQMARDSMAG